MPLPRFDGTLATDVPAYRRMVPFLMRGRNEAAVYFEQTLDLSSALPWIEAWNERHRERGLRITVFHLFLGAFARMMAERPRLNRFVSGQRIYQRHGVWVSFAAKKRMDDDASMQIVKRELDAAEPFDTMVERLSGQIDVARSDARSRVDQELSIFLRLPRPVLAAAVRLLRWLDFHNLAPRALLEPDPMYASLFISNLGSIKIDAAYHHLYEYGNCPLFATIGRIVHEPVADADGTVAVRPIVRFKYVYDERIEDGLYCARALELLRGYVEDPASWAE